MGGSKSSEGFTAMGGPTVAEKKYAESLLRLVHASNRNEALSSARRVDVASSVLAIIADEDPPIEQKGRGS